MTPAVVLLSELGIEHELVTYEHDPSADGYGTEAAHALGLDPDTVFKTLLVELVGGDRPDELAVAVVPVSGMLDLKAAARAFGAKKATMSDPDRAERSSGYVVGGISPLGQKTSLRTVIDEIAFACDVVHVSGGRRGLEIRLAPADLARATEATVAAVSAS